MTEEKLIANCIKGDAQSQRLFFDQYTPTLFAVAIRYARSREDAEDVLQESWVKIFNALSTYENKGKLHSWMKTIVINTALRSNQKAYFKNEKNGFDAMIEESVDPDIIESMNYHEIRALVDKLPDGYAEVFKLAIIDDFKHKEIADLLGIAESTSRVKLTIARKKMQILVNELNNKYVLNK
jgi:RNA polymerase sigma-70 factor (ECF subfamily)